VASVRSPGASRRQRQRRSCCGCLGNTCSRPFLCSGAPHLRSWIMPGRSTSARTGSKYRRTAFRSVSMGNQDPCDIRHTIVFLEATNPNGIYRISRQVVIGWITVSNKWWYLPSGRYVYCEFHRHGKPTQPSVLAPREG